MVISAKSTFLYVSTLMFLSGCVQPAEQWHLALSHDNQGDVLEGSESRLVSAIRQGCNIKVAWGARRKADASRTIEHSARPIWISVRDGSKVEVQIGDFLINLKVLGEPTAEHPRREQFGGTDKAVKWRAALKTDGSFDAVWYYPHSGDFIKRVPQRYSMKWFTDCRIKQSKPLYPERAKEGEP
ncbi:MAG: hypothetical protein JKX72_05560 [Robiginitomaculum sp.]|nr:hypothetical protein [Robiginitomaculum sp.]